MARRARDAGARRSRRGPGDALVPRRQGAARPPARCRAPRSPRCPATPCWRATCWLPGRPSSWWRWRGGTGASPPADVKRGGSRPGRCAELGPLLDASLRREGLERVFTDIEMPLVPVLEAMERTGIRLDAGGARRTSPERLETLPRRASSATSTRRRAVRSTSTRRSSWPRCCSPAAGCRCCARTAKTKAPSTDADVLQELAARGFRLPALILEYREQAKLKSTYVDALPRQVAADGRIHTRFNQAVAATGRLSSSDPNLQNIPVRSGLGRAVRERVRGRARVACWWPPTTRRSSCGCWRTWPTSRPCWRAFAAGEDIHCGHRRAGLRGGAGAGRPRPAARRQDHQLRPHLRHGRLLLGSRPRGPDGRGPALHRHLLRPACRGCASTSRGSRRRLARTGRVSTLFGRVRRIAGLQAANAQLRGNAERQAINAPVQGTAADLIKLAMIRLHERLAARAAARLRAAGPRRAHRRGARGGRRGCRRADARGHGRGGRAARAAARRCRRRPLVGHGQGVRCSHANPHRPLAAAPRFDVVGPEAVGDTPGHRRSAVPVELPAIAPLNPFATPVSTPPAAKTTPLRTRSTSARSPPRSLRTSTSPARASGRCSCVRRGVGWVPTCRPPSPRPPSHRAVPSAGQRRPGCLSSSTSEGRIDEGRVLTVNVTPPDPATPPDTDGAAIPTAREARPRPAGGAGREAGPAPGRQALQGADRRAHVARERPLPRPGECAPAASRRSSS